MLIELYLNEKGQKLSEKEISEKMMRYQKFVNDFGLNDLGKNNGESEQILQMVVNELFEEEQQDEISHVKSSLGEPVKFYLCLDCLVLNNKSKCKKCGQELKNKNRKYSKTRYKKNNNSFIEYHSTILSGGIRTLNDYSIEKSWNVINFKTYGIYENRVEFKIGKNLQVYPNRKYCDYIRILSNGQIVAGKFNSHPNGKENIYTRREYIKMDFFSGNDDNVNLDMIALFVLFLQNNNLMNFYLENFNIFYILKKESSPYFIKRCYEDKKFFQRVIFHNKYDHRTFKLIQKINKIDNPLKKIIIEFKNLDIKEFLSTASKEQNKFYKTKIDKLIAYKRANELYIKRANIRVNLQEITKKIKNINIVNNLLEIILESFKARNEIAKKAYFNYDSMIEESFDIAEEISGYLFNKFYYIFVDLFGYSEKEFVNLFFKKLLRYKDIIEQNIYSGTGIHQSMESFLTSDLHALLVQIKYTRKWKSILKYLFKEFVNIHPNWKNRNFLERYFNFMEFCLLFLDKEKTRKMKQEKIEYPKKYFKIFEKTINNIDFKIPVTKFDFVQIGTIMHNCVGSYFDLIKSEYKQRIIAIGYNTNNIPIIAIEILIIKKGKNKYLSFNQVLGPYNQNLNKEENKIVEKYFYQVSQDIKKFF